MHNTKLILKVNSVRGWIQRDEFARLVIIIRQVEIGERIWLLHYW